jgi:circadian clock protein KaiB
MKRRRGQRCEVIATGVNAEGVLKKLSGEPAPKYKLRLYIAGTNLNSGRAIQNIRALFRSMHPTQFELEIIDLYQQPGLAKRDDVVAAPVLVKIFPPPRRTFLGDLSDSGKVLTGLGITTARIRDVGRKP